MTGEGGLAKNGKGWGDLGKTREGGGREERKMSLPSAPAGGSRGSSDQEIKRQFTNE